MQPIDGVRDSLDALAQRGRQSQVVAALGRSAKWVWGVNVHVVQALVQVDGALSGSDADVLLGRNLLSSLGHFD